MAQRCDICGKQPVYGNNVSHSHTKTRRRWSPNIQKIRISVNGTTKNANVCTQCIKSGKIVKAV